LALEWKREPTKTSERGVEGEASKINRAGRKKRRKIGDEPIGIKDQRKGAHSELGE